MVRDVSDSIRSSNNTNKEYFNRIMWKIRKKDDKENKNKKYNR
jgi:hypothetical protein